jgi:SulP family sulfate permease
VTGAKQTTAPLVKVGRGDLIAGISVAFVLIPQALAYAELAGLPAYVGLYAAALPPLAASFFASSRYLQTGPVAMTALLTFGALSPLAAAGSPEWIELAALLALVVGVARIGLGLARAGVFAYFMSQPILLGFTSAAAILIISSQLPTALGVDAAGEKLLARAWWALTHPGHWETTALILSIVTVILVLGGRRLHKLFPGVLIAVIVGLVYSVADDYTGSTVGDVPEGFLPFSLALPWSDLPSLLIPGAVIALVGFAEPASIARMFAAQDRERWSPSKELISQGVANLAAGISGGFPVGGSFSRSSIARLAGGQSRWAGAITGLVVLAFLPIAGILGPLPRAVLAAIVIAAVYKLVELIDLARIFRVSRPQAMIAWVTFAATLVLSPRIELGVIVGVVLGIAVHLWRELVVRVDTDVIGGELHLKPRGVLFYASAPPLNETLLDQLATHPDAGKLVIDLRRLGRIDYTGALSLRQVVEEAVAAGLEVRVIGVPAQTRKTLPPIWEEAIPPATSDQPPTDS